MEVKNIAVIGAGQMGSGIAQVCAQAGFQVMLQDIDQEAVDHGMNGIHGLLSRAVEKGKMAENEKEGTLSRLTGTTDLGDVHEADLVIEAVIENLDVKKELFQQLDKIVAAHTILATNTSSLPVTEIAATTNRPEKVIGMHFMNPVPVMKLVEVIRAIQTDDQTYKAIVDVTKDLYKTAVTVNDFPGFVSNRILMPMINEAI